MKFLKTVIISCLIIGAAWLFMRSFAPTGLKSCKEFLSQINNYQNQITALLDQASSLKYKWGSPEEKETYKGEVYKISQELQRLTPPEELKSFHMKIQESFEAQKQLTEFVNIGNRTKALEYGGVARRAFQEAFEGLKQVWVSKGCSEEEFKKTFWQLGQK